MTQIYLASQSPRRAELLKQIAVSFEKLSIETDETPLPNESAKAYVERVARAKAEAGYQQLVDTNKPLMPVLGADTTVVLGQQIMGKPADRAQALAMLAALSGSSHQVMSAVCLRYQNTIETALSVTEVSFRSLTAAECEDYWLTGEPVGKAGGYAIQGRAAVFVEKIVGSYSGVVGLPLMETQQLITRINRKIAA